MVTFPAESRAHFSDTDAAGIVHFSTIFFWVEATEEAVRYLRGLPLESSVPEDEYASQELQRD